MSSPLSLEFSARTIIERLASGVVPRDMVENIARGFLPLAQEDLIPVLAYLALSDDATVAALARASVGEVPSRIVHGFASNEAATPEHLVLLMRASDDAGILEALIRNRAVPDQAVADLARRADAALQEVVVINQARIIRAPEILDALLANPRLSAETRRRALETREEFFDKKARIEAARVVEEDEPDVELPVDAIADLLEKAAAEDQDRRSAKPPEKTEADERDPKRKSIYQEIVLMTVSEKVQAAFKGGKTARTILVRDHNKLVCAAVMRNPRMSESEVESIAGMRGVDEEVLRLIGVRRDWSSKYNITIALARNPKAPIGVVLPLINRLTLRDLKSLKDDKGVTDTVRSIARKLFAQRSKKS